MITIKEEFLSSVKTKRAVKLGGGDAVLLWLAIKGYVAESNTGGFIPEDAIEDLPCVPKRWQKAMGALVDCGKTRPDGSRGPGLVVQVEHGYQLHDYDDHGTLVEVEEERRRKAREARAKHRASLRVGPSVYFARVLNSGLVKIGYSENPHDRCRTLPADLGSKVELIGYEPGTKEDEARLHAEFAEERRGNTELFKPTDRVLARAMRSSFRSGPDPDPIRKPDPKTRSGPDPNDRKTRSDTDPPRAYGHAPVPTRAPARPQPSPAQPVDHTDDDDPTLTGGARVQSSSAASDLVQRAPERQREPGKPPRPRHDPLGENMRLADWPTPKVLLDWWSELGIDDAAQESIQAAIQEHHGRSRKPIGRWDELFETYTLTEVEKRRKRAVAPGMKDHETRTLIEECERGVYGPRLQKLAEAGQPDLEEVRKRRAKKLARQHRETGT